MILRIDTSSNENIVIAILDDNDIIVEKTIEAKYRQSEKLLPFLADILDKQGLTIKDIHKIMVNDEGEGFSSLRIGVLTANALAYALRVPLESFSGDIIDNGSFKIVKPNYSQEPNIG